MKAITRRDFLKGIAGGAGIAAVSAFMGNSAFADAEGVNQETVVSLPEDFASMVAESTVVTEPITAFAEEHTIPVENVCSPEPLRRVVWTPPREHSEPAFTTALAAQGVRPWQRAIVAPMLVRAFAESDLSD